MNSRRAFWWTLLFGETLLILQCVCAYFDGYLTQSQMHANGVMNGYSFMDHGGMWADVFIISPLVAYIVSRYRLPYTSWYSLLLLPVILVALAFAGRIYAEMALQHPEAHTHGGTTTLAGWIHGLFALGGIWVTAMFYLTPISPPASTRDIVFISAVLTPFFVLGVIKFNNQWQFDSVAQWLVVMETVTLWAIVGIRLSGFRRAAGHARTAQDSQ